MKTIVLTGGGTGGHVIPHLSILPYIKKEFDNIYYIGSQNGIEKEIISRQTDIKYFEIPTVKFVRKLTPKNLLIPFKLLNSIKKTKKILKRLNPDAIFSKGGFVSVPVAIAGKSLKIPIISHESDLSFGLANKIIYKYCNKMCTTFEKTTQNKKKCIHTGAPIRQKLFNGNKENGYKLTNINKFRPTILFVGGSTGATTLNNIIYKTLPQLLKKYNVIHIVGKNKGNKNIIYKNYAQLEFVENIEDIFVISDIIVSRAGSNAIYEFLALKKPMLLIPLPKEQSRGDQIENAEYFASFNIAKVLKQENLTQTTLIKEINNLFNNKEQIISNMLNIKLKNGNEEIFKTIKKYTKR